MSQTKMHTRDTASQKTLNAVCRNDLPFNGAPAAVAMQSPTSQVVARAALSVMLLLAILASMLVTRAADAQTSLYTYNNGNMYSVATSGATAGAATSIGVVTMPNMNGATPIAASLALDAAGANLYYLDAEASATPAVSPVLYRFPLPAGPAVLVGPLQPGCTAATTPPCRYWPRLAFAQTGTLYAMSTDGTRMGTINTTTGVITDFATTGVAAAGGGDFAIAPNGLFYMVVANVLYSVTTAGFVTNLGTITGAPATSAGIAWDSNTGSLMLLGTDNQIYRISNLATRTASTTGFQATGATALGDLAAVPAAAGLPPIITKSFATNPVAVNTNSLMTITLTNPNPIRMTGVNFTDTYPVGLVNNGGATVSNTCISATIGSVAVVTDGTTTVSANATNPGVTTLTNGIIPPNGTCTITVNVQSATAGAYTNTIPAGAVTSSFYPASTTPASDVLVVGRAKLDKAFSGALIEGGTTTLTYTLTSATAFAVSFTDTLPAGLRVAAVPAVGGTCTGGTVTATALANTVTVAARNVPAGTPCTITVDVTTAAAATTGTCPQPNNTNGNANISAVTNVSADITDSAAGGGTAAAGTGACVTVTPSVNLSVTKSDAKIATTTGTNNVYSIVVSNTGLSAANNAVLRDPAATGLNCLTPPATLTCAVTTGAAVCPLAAVLTLANLQSAGGIPILTLPPSSSLTFTLTCNVTATGS